MKDIIDKYHQYVLTFNQTDARIPYKFEHSLRVMEKMKMLSTSLQQNAEEKKLSTVIGLFHDYGRFYQVENFKTYQDVYFDHGNYGAEQLINQHHLQDFLLDSLDERVIYDAIKNHNKYQIEEGLSAKSLFFSKMIRDADKLDILEGLSRGYIQIPEVNQEVSTKVEEEFYHHQSIHSENVQNESDRMIAFLGYLYDFNFEWSIMYLKEHQIVEKIINKINHPELVQEYFKYILDYIDTKEKEKVYARKEI